MSRYNSTQPLPASRRARAHAEDIARAAGRLGAVKVPDEALVLAGSDPSDSQIVALLSALEAGQLERRMQDGTAEASGDAIPSVGPTANRMTCLSGPEMQEKDSVGGHLHADPGYLSAVAEEMLELPEAT